MKTIMIINAPEDSNSAASICKHLIMSKRNRLIEYTDDLSNAQIVLCLLSPSFVNDERSWSLSEQAKRIHAAGNCRLIPIYVQHLSETPDHLALLVYLPRNGKPATTDEAWSNIAREIRALALS